MRYSKYTIFLKVVELESFSKTADFYKYSQSAVTQIVKSLETELQMTLLKRRSVSDFRRRTAHPLYMGTGNGRRKNVGKSRRNHRNGPGTDPDRGIQQYCVSLSAGGDERIPKIISGN